MPKFQIQRYEQILAKMIARVVTATKLSDVTDASVVKHVLAAAARSDDELSYNTHLLLQAFSIDTASGEDLDARAREIQPAAISRLSAIKATDNSLVFTRRGTVGTTLVPIGTQVKTSDGQIFITTSAGSITATSPEQIVGHGVGRDSDLVSSVAALAGSSGNVAAGTIIKFVSRPPGIDEVINQSPTVGGQDKESDDAFRSRIKQYIQGLAKSVVAAIENAVLGVADPDTGAVIRYSKAWEDPEIYGRAVLYIDNGTGSSETTEDVVDENVTYGLAGPPPNSAVGGEEVLYTDYKPIKDEIGFSLNSSVQGALTRGTDFVLNPANGQLGFITPLVTGEVITASYTRFTGLIELAQRIVDGDRADRANYPGYRALGVRVLVRAPQTILQSVEVSLIIAEGYDPESVRASVTAAIVNYINRLGISEDVQRATLFVKIMAVAGVKNCVISTPSTDIVILDDQIARTTTSAISVT